MSSFRQEIRGRRFAAGHYDDGGKWIEGAAAPLVVFASVQPSTRKDMEIVPEGRRGQASFTLYSDIELRIGKEGGPNADEVTLFGEPHEIVAVAPWQNRILPHYRSVAQRKQP